MTTIELIAKHIRALSGDLFVAARKLGPREVELIGSSEGIGPEMLPGLTVAELQRHDDPTGLLATICSLLLRLGDEGSLRIVLKLSYKIRDLELGRGEDSLLPDLYRGISQTGLGITQIGTKNVLAGLPPMHGIPIAPLDKCLGFRALMSAAIVNRNILLALRYGEEWLATAKGFALDEQAFNAKAAMQILRLLLADAPWCLENIKDLKQSVPKENQEAVGFLETWTQMLVDGKQAPFKDFHESLPLLPGLDWHDLSPTHDDLRSADFRLLCNLTRRFYRKSSLKELSTPQLTDLARVFASWELAGRFSDAAEVLKETDTDAYLHFDMARILGTHALEFSTRAPSSLPGFRILPDAVIWMMDVRGFSRFSQAYPPQSLFEILSPLYKIIHEELESAGGTIHEFVGDSVMVVFNTGEQNRSAPLDILSGTVRAIERIRILNSLNLPASMPELRIGVGINKGPAATGYLGGLSRCHLSVLGDTVNIAARIEQATKEAPGPVLVSRAFFADREPEVWRTPLKVNFSLREAGQRSMKNISNIPTLYSVKPLLNYWVDFVPMGYMARRQKGVVYIDTGNSADLGIIDHHHPEGREAGSACELLFRKPQLLLGHLQGISSSQIEFRLHEQPDLDCVATFYAACELLDGDPRQDIIKLLADYVSKIDRGIIPQPETVADSLYGVFIAHQKRVEDQFGARITDSIRLEAGLRVIDCAFYLMERSRLKADFADIFRFGGGWFEEERRMVSNDWSLYEEDRELRGHTYSARVNGLPGPVEGLWLDHPLSLLFKFWARNDRRAEGGAGYAFLAVDWSEEGKNRFVISVAPDAGLNLKSLGESLESEERARREKLGRQRPVHPIRYPSDNSDPWYFGWSHDHTIVDSPRNGTVLTNHEVQRVHESWSPG